MDTIINKYQFNSKSGSDYPDLLNDMRNFNNEIYNETNRKKMAEVMKGIAALKLKISSVDFFDGNEYSDLLAFHAMKQIVSLAEDALRNEDLPDLKVSYQKEMVQIYLACVQYGAGTGHLLVISAQSNNYSKHFLEEYLEALPDNDPYFKELFKALKREFVPSACTEDRDRWAGEVNDAMRRLFGHVEDRCSPALLECCFTEIHELLTHVTYHSVNAATKQLRNVYCNMQCKIHRSFSAKQSLASCYLFTVRKDGAVLHNNYKLILTACQTWNFTDEKIGVMEDWLAMLLAPALEAGDASVSVRITDLAPLVQEACTKKSKLPEYIRKQFRDKFRYAMRNIHSKFQKEQANDIVPVFCKTVKDIVQATTTTEELTEYSEVLASITEYTIMANVKNPAMGSHLLTILADVIKIQHENAVTAVCRAMENAGKYMNWKEHENEAVRLAQSVLDCCYNDFFGNERNWSKRSDLGTITEKLCIQMKKLKVEKWVAPVLIEMFKKLFTDPNKPIGVVAYSREVQEALSVKDYEDDIVAILNLCGEFFLRDDIGEFIDTHTHYISACVQLVTGSSSQLSDKGLEAVGGAVLKLAQYVSGWNVMDTDLTTTCRRAMQSGVLVYTMKIASLPHVLGPFVEPILAWCKHEDSNVQNTAASMGFQAFHGCPKVVAGHLDEFVSLLNDPVMQNANCGLYNVGRALFLAYDENPSLYRKHLRTICEALDKDDQALQTIILQLMDKVAEKSPQDLTSEYITKIVEVAQKKPETLGALSYMMFVKVADRNSDLLIEFRQFFYSQSGMHTGLMYLGIQILGKLARKHKKYQDEIIQHFNKILTCGTSASTEKEWILTELLNIGRLNVQIVSPYKKLYVELQQDPHVKGAATNLLDVIEGRSLAGLSEELGEQKEDIEQVQTGLVLVGSQVTRVEGHVDQNTQAIGTLNEDLTITNQRVDTVQVDLQETKVKVEEVDHKTMSNAPAWSRDVTKLLNPDSPQDWRLLAQRLGYTAGDIRAWGAQYDPCMALLSEWYATHRAVEATHAVLKALEEMNREDAAIIVREALKNMKDLIDDDDDSKPSGPLPPIFLSYQWSHQTHAKLLKQHLENAGFRCWMDLGQMGGGDKLFAKIDAGMRGCKVVVCCTTEKYAKSDNCNREVNLAVTLGKPIIPLMIEKMAWPPEGSMGPIFGEYLFVRFFQRAGESTGDNRFWPADKFKELLMQIRYTVAPDENIVIEPYKNWWLPDTDEVLVIPQSIVQESANSATTTTESPGELVNPEVFISYQWGKQTQVKALYNRLSRLGYTCWLDICQMGGGDSLFDKIDRGVRGCKVVVSCVTPKYSLSANCRREVSLADALKKPIVPLLLEDMTWPPEGPMSLVFTQLLYIGFHQEHPEVQTRWDGPKFEELLAKLEKYVPKNKSPQQLPTTTSKPGKVNQEVKVKTENLSSEVKGKPENHSSEVKVKPENDSSEVKVKPENGSSEVRVKPENGRTAAVNRPESGNRAVAGSPTPTSVVRSPPPTPVVGSTVPKPKTKTCLIV